jgi:hypothetical protein
MKSMRMDNNLVFIVIINTNHANMAIGGGKTKTIFISI